MANKVGRPTKYKKRYCKDVISHMCQGYSFETFAVDLDVNRTTLYEWRDNHEEFSNAVKKGFDARAKFLEAEYLECASGANPNAVPSMQIFRMKALAGWTETTKIEQETTLKVEGSLAQALDDTEETK